MKEAKRWNQHIFAENNNRATEAAAANIVTKQDTPTVRKKPSCHEISWL